MKKIKILNIKRNTLFKFLSIIIFAFTIAYLSKTYGMQNYYNLDFKTGIVTASSLNLRSGPGTNYPTITTIPKNQYIRVFAGIGNWYIVQVEGDYVGAVNKQYVKAIYPNQNNTTNSNNANNNANTGSTNKANISNLTADELETFNLINEQRSKNGLPKLQIDLEVQRVARIKAKDMVDKNYFSHTSPTYGSPFDMLKSFGISYKSAGENIAGNSSNSSAVNAWMNSSGHRANILNNSFNYTGVGVVNGSKYGKIYVQMFIGK